MKEKIDCCICNTYITVRSKSLIKLNEVCAVVHYVFAHQSECARIFVILSFPLLMVCAVCSFGHGKARVHNPPLIRYGQPKPVLSAPMSMVVLI